MKIFITGIAGFLGSHLADALIAEGHDVSGIDTFVGGERDNIPKGVAWFNDTDCRSRQDLTAQIQSIRPDVLYHCAALAHEGLSVFSPSLISDSILGASASVFSAAIAAGVKRIVFMSSMARYGNPQNDEYGDDPWRPFREDVNMPHGVDPYGICKVAAEDMLRMLCETHDVEYVIAVPHNIYGPRQKYDDPFRNVAAIMANRMLQGKPPIIYGDGEQRRCFSYIDDVVPPLVKMATQSNVVGEVINIGPDEGTVTIKELTHLLTEIIGYYGNINYVPARPAEVKFATCSADKARRLLNYEAKTPLREGLVKLVDFIRERGPKPFQYHLPIEIQSALTPKTWSERTI